MDKAVRIAAAPALAVLLLALCAKAMAADSPAKMRSESARLERQYIELYNKLNTDPQFEIVCRNEKPTGSNFNTRVCRARYLLDAMQASATERMRSAISNNANSAPANAAGSSGGIELTGTGLPIQPDLDEAFRKNVLAMQAKSPELQALGTRRDVLQKQLDAAAGGKGSKNK
jgi:hypothetical protein